MFLTKLLTQLWFGLAVWAPFAGPKPAQDDQSRLYKEAYALILKEEWAAAEKQFSEYVNQFPKSGWVDDATFWICYSKDKGRLPDEASFQCYRDFIRQFPGSEWADDARRNLVILGKRLARNGQPEFLSQAESMAEDDDYSDSPESEMLAMLASLGEVDDERSRKLLFRYLEQSRDEHLRARIVLLMEEIHGPEVEKKLMDLVLNDPSLEVRENAVHILIDKRGEKTKKFLMEIAASKDAPRRLRMEVISHLGEWEFPGRVAYLKKIIVQENDSEIAEEAMHALGEIGSQEAIDGLFELFEKLPSHGMKEEILDALGDTESPEVLSFLIKLAATEQDPQMAKMAVRAIGEFDENKALPALDHVISSNLDWSVKIAAVYTLGEFETLRAVKALQDLLDKEANLGLRRAAVARIGRYGPG